MKVDEDEKFPYGSAGSLVAGGGMQRGLECMGPSGRKALRMTSVLKKSRCSELKARVILHRSLGAEAPLFQGGLGRPIHATKERAGWEKKRARGKRKRHGLAVPFLRRRTGPCDVGPGLRKP
jgi:hypothetical protein